MKLGNLDKMILLFIGIKKEISFKEIWKRFKKSSELRQRYSKEKYFYLTLWQESEKLLKNGYIMSQKKMLTLTKKGYIEALLMSQDWFDNPKLNQALSEYIKNNMER